MFLLSKDLDLPNYAILHGKGSLAQWVETQAVGSDSLPECGGPSSRRADRVRS